MSEKIYAFLLRLYPSRFRETYGAAALQLFRDRSRDERGFFARLRLWLDLLADFAISLPREYRHRRAALAGAYAGLRVVPSFQFLEGESPRPEALLFGAVLSLAAIWASSTAMGQGGRYRPTDRSSARVVIEVKQWNDAEKQRMINAVITNLKEHYVDPNLAQEMADAITAHQKKGDYDAVTDGAAFAELLTRQLREVSGDMHLEVVYSQTPLPNRSAGPTPEAMARYRIAMEQQNCTFEKIEMLPHKAGYLKLNSFPDPSVCESTARAAMASLNQADAVIFDLRDNRGGYPDMVSLIAAYLFNYPEYLYNPRENTTERSWTRSPVPGNKLADKPVYVLTSGRTASGAEQFSYDLKMLKRVTLVGETTHGAAHAGSFQRLDDHFGMGIPEVRAINPFSKTDWEGVGVEPDVKVRAADALEAAKKMTESRLQRK